jgi:cell wall-associated NlpC family hydrolase
MEKKDQILLQAIKLLGVPYIWGGQSPKGFDCSGFVIWLFTQFELLPAGFDTTANGLWEQFGKEKCIKAPDQCRLIFYGVNGKAHHVMLCVNDKYCIGASNGDSTCTDYGIAKRKNAEVMIRRIGYRPDFLGYGEICSD